MICGAYPAKTVNAKAELVIAKGGGEAAKGFCARATDYAFLGGALEAG